MAGEVLSLDAALPERVRRSRASVLTATHELLRSSGLSGVSIDEISRRCGVAKTTIYRHWPSRSALLLDACAHIMSASLPAPDTGSLRGDLLALAHEIARQLQTSAWAAVAPSIMDAAEHDQEIGEFQARQHNAMLAPFRTVLQREGDRGQPAPDTAETVASILGPLFYRRWTSREPIDNAFVEHVVDRALTKGGV